MISPYTLLKMNFKKVETEGLDDGDFYDVFSIEKNNSRLDVVFNYNPSGELVLQYCDFNGETLKGKPLPSIADLLRLIMLM